MAQAVEAGAHRDEFPMTSDWAYLNHAAHGPYPTRTVKALQDYAASWASPSDYDGSRSDRVIAEAREGIAELAGGSPSMVTFNGSLAEGMNLLANGIDWKEGDNVLIPVEEFPSVVYPFLNLQYRGVTVRFVEKNAEGRTDIGLIEAAMDERTRAVALSHVEFMDGYRNDLKVLGSLCQSKGVELFVDATQSLGAQPIDLNDSGVTAVAAHAYKWLLAGFGIAAVVFADGAIERIRPTYAGRMSVDVSWEDSEYRLNFKPTAERYQTGGMNIIGLTALQSSLSLVRDVGPAWNAQHTASLIDRLAEGVTESGYRVVSTLDPHYRSQIVAITSGDLKRDGEIVEELEKRNVSVTLRGRGIRVSPYFYNTTEDIDRLLEALPPR